MGVTHVCFGLSYLFAFGLVLAGQARPARAARVGAMFFGAAGLVAHTIFLVAHQPNPAAPFGALVLLAWVLAVFYQYGTVHHKSQAWGAIHGILVLAASVGITVGFLASVMYLVQARRLQKKRNPLGGLRLLSLERLETMNRRAINLAFPLLTVGLLLGAVRVPASETPTAGWTDPKVLGTIGLWVVAVVLLYLRYRAHLPARRLAWLTLAAFGLMLVTLIASPPFATGEGAR